MNENGLEPRSAYEDMHNYTQMRALEEFANSDARNFTASSPNRLDEIDDIAGSIGRLRGAVEWLMTEDGLEYVLEKIKERQKTETETEVKPEPELEPEPEDKTNLDPNAIRAIQTVATSFK